VTTGTAREAAVPTQIAGILLQHSRGEVTPALAAEAASLCVDCGACQEHCHIHHPLPELLRMARGQLLPTPSMEALQAVEGEGSLIVVESDERPLARAVAKRLGTSVRRWPTRDAFGAAAVEHDVWSGRAQQLRDVVGEATVIVADGAVAHALDSAGVATKWLHDHLAVDGLLNSCRSGGTPGPTACCGGAGPLKREHPSDAEILGKWWLDRAEPARYADSRCRNHLRSCGGEVTDLVDELVGDLQ